MTDERFERFWPKLLKYEGGYVNDPDDPGGETKYGICKRSYPNFDIKRLTEQQAKDIYFSDYYTLLKIPSINDERLSWQLFDFGVNAGIFKSAKTLQGILNVAPDGIIGPRTLDKIKTWEDEYPLWMCYIAERIKYYLAIAERRPASKKFLKGWLLRAAEL